MDIDGLPDRCPQCGSTRFRQKITIEGFATKIFSMSNLSVTFGHPVTFTENELAENDYYNDIVCNDCGAVIVEAEITLYAENKDETEAGADKNA